MKNFLRKLGPDKNYSKENLYYLWRLLLLLLVNLHLIGKKTPIFTVTYEDRHKYCYNDKHYEAIFRSRYNV